MLTIRCASCGEELKISDLALGGGGRAECIYCGAMNDIPKPEKPKAPASRLAQGILLSVGALVLGACLYLGLYLARTEPPPPESTWECEKCRARFWAPGQASPIPCRDCGSQTAVRLALYRCKACGTEFERFRMLQSAAANGPEEGRRPLDRLELKPPGGSWVKALSPEGSRLLTELRCPKCGNADLQKLVPSGGG